MYLVIFINLLDLS